MDKPIVKWYPGVKEKLLNTYPDKIIYEVASMTLDMAYTTIPLGKTSNLRKTSKSEGVRGQKKDYYIGSYTNYAKYVWDLPDNTKWTTPGTTNKWYEKYYKENGKVILESAIERNKLK